MRYDTIEERLAYSKQTGHKRGISLMLWTADDAVVLASTKLVSKARAATIIAAQCTVRKAWQSAVLHGTGGGAWQVTVSRASSLEQAIQSAVCKLRPLEIRHSSHTTSSGAAESMVSVSTGCSTLLLLYLRKHAAHSTAPARPAARHSRRELSFAEHHGAISCHDWLPDGKLVLGFSTGSGVDRARVWFATTHAHS